MVTGVLDATVVAGAGDGATPGPEHDTLFLFTGVSPVGEPQKAQNSQKGDDLVKAGDFDDAREYYTLAMDQTQDDDLMEELEAGLRNLESRQAEKYGREIQDNDEPEQEAIDEPEPESADEYSNALC